MNEEIEIIAPQSTYSSQKAVECGKYLLDYIDLKSISQEEAVKIKEQLQILIHFAQEARSRCTFQSSLDSFFNN